MVSFPSDVGLSILKAWKRSEWQGAYDSPGRPGLGFRTALGQTWVFSDFGPLLSENPQHAATGPPVGNQLLISFSVSSTSTGQGRERGVEEDDMQCLKLEKCTLTLGRQSGCKELGTLAPASSRIKQTCNPWHATEPSQASASSLIRQG